MSQTKATIGLLGLLAVWTLSACSTHGAPLDHSNVREVVDYQLFVLQTGVERGDIALASLPIDDRFTMDNTVAARYSDRNWEGRGQSSFRSFLNDTFNLHGNIEFELQLGNLQQDGNLATATVNASWRSQRKDSIPPGQYLSIETDYMLFQRKGSAWRLLRWQQTPDPAAPPD
jgi:ketosteroid isomerase-like protein